MSAFKNKLWPGIHVRPEGLALAVAYALACWGTRQVSLDQFYLPAGIRLAALLLCPPRLWPYLLLGEYSYFAHLRYPMVETYGVPWAILASALPMPAVMLIVRSHRRMIALRPDIAVLSIAASAAVVVSLMNICLSRLLWSALESITFSGRSAQLVIGQFMTMVALAPPAMLWARRHVDAEWNRRLATYGAGCVILMLVIGLSLTLTSLDNPSTRSSASLLIALPAIALTWMHGWRGAAIGVAVLNLLVHVNTESTGAAGSFDSNTFGIQQSMLVISVALLALGSSISHHRRHARANGLGETTALRLARSSHQASERDLRGRATHLKQLGEGMDNSLVEMVGWLRAQGHHTVASSLQHATTVHSRLFRAQASLIYPTALEQVGLYVALQAGGVRESWELSHRVTSPRLTGNPCLLSLDLQLATYRTLVDAVSLLLELESGQLSVHARCGQVGGQRGIAMTVALLDRDRALSVRSAEQAFEMLAGRTMAYGGSVHCHRNRIRLVLLESAAQHRRAPVQPT